MKCTLLVNGRLCIFSSILLVVSSCSLLNERTGPGVESCADIQGPNVCRDNIIAYCATGDVKYEFCDDSGQPCVFIDDATGYACGCRSDTDCPGNYACKDRTCVQRAAGPEIIFSAFQVTKDDNGDGQVNKGEDISLNIQVKNSGTSQANHVDGVLSTTDSFVSISDSSISFGAISAGESKWGGYAQGYEELKFSVMQTVPPGHTINFGLSVTDEEGNTWNLNFDVPVVATGANIVYQAHAVVKDDNSDGQVNKGENISFNIQVKNSGTSQANHVDGVLSTTDSVVSISDSSISFGAISAGESKWGGYAQGYEDLKFKVDATTPVGHTISFTLDILDEQGNQWTFNFGIEVH